MDYHHSGTWWWWRQHYKPKLVVMSCTESWSGDNQHPSINVKFQDGSFLHSVTPHTHHTHTHPTLTSPHATGFWTLERGRRALQLFPQMVLGWKESPYTNLVLIDTSTLQDSGSVTDPQCLGLRVSARSTRGFSARQPIKTTIQCAFKGKSTHYYYLCMCVFKDKHHLQA